MSSRLNMVVHMEFDPRTKYSDKNLIPKKTATYLGPTAGGDTQLSVFEALEKFGNFKTLIKAIKATGLEEKFRYRVPTTLFAPTDDAFNKLPADNMNVLLNNPETLTDLLLFHVHPGKLNVTRNARSFNTALKEGGKKKQLSVKVASWTEEVFIVTGQPNHPQVTTRAIRCTNGLIHVLNEVMIPYEGLTPPQVTFIGARDLDNEATLQPGYYGALTGTNRFGGKYEGPKRDYEFTIPSSREAWVAATYHADPATNVAGGMSSLELEDW